MKVLTVALILSTSFYAGTVFAAHDSAEKAPKRKNLDKLMGGGAQDAAHAMQAENYKMNEAAQLEKKGQILESQVARGVVEQHREARINKNAEVLKEEKIKIYQLREAKKLAIKEYVDTSIKNQSNKNWNKGEEAKKLKEEIQRVNKELSMAEEKYQNQEKAVEVEKAALAGA